MKDFRANFDRAASIARWTATTGLRWTVQFCFSAQAIFWLPKGWVPHAVEWILSFPSAPLGSISINTWWIACASVIAMASDATIALWTLRSGKVQIGENRGEKIKMEEVPGAAGSNRPSGGMSEKKEL